jgi:hypothetical protein
MAPQFRFPCPCEYFPQLETRHEAATLIAEYQADGHIKKCAHLHIATSGSGFGGEYYGPRCRRDSFDIGPDDRGHARKLFYGCPRDCRLYRRAWVGKTEEWLNKRWWRLRGTIVGVAQWYASLSAVAQVILALAVLALVGAPWRDTILDGLKIVFGK